MTEDRLTHLLAEATDLAPSEALRSQVENLPLTPFHLGRAGAHPSADPPLPRREEGFRRSLWFVLSCTSAAVAAVAFLATPRSASAAELLRRADEAVRANLTFRTVSEDNGARGNRWGVHTRGLHAPRWSLEEWSDGRFELNRPGAAYARFDLSGPIRMTHRVRTTPAARAAEDDPSPENHVRLLRSMNPGRDGEFGLTLGRTLEEDGRRLREIVIAQPRSDWMRTRYLVDEATSLPARVEEDLHVGDAWRLNSRTTYTFPGPEAGSEAFLRPLRSAPVVDIDAEEALWTRRLARVQRTLWPTHGEPLAVRDLRTLSNGEVLMLYTGPQRVLARLEGPGEEPYALCHSVAWAALYPDRRHVVRMLHFVPLRGAALAKGPLRLALSWNGRPNGSFLLEPAFQSGERPTWATAMNAPFGREGDLLRKEARVAALTDRWLDAEGRVIVGTFGQDPDAELRTVSERGLVAPRGAVRPDPRSSAEAAVLVRRLLAEGWPEDPFWTSRLLAKLDRRARGG